MAGNLICGKVFTNLKRHFADLAIQLSFSFVLLFLKHFYS